VRTGTRLYEKEGKYEVNGDYTQRKVMYDQPAPNPGVEQSAFGRSALHNRRSVESRP
jgi:hypothetical protein